MSKNILQQVLDFEENKKNYNVEDREKIKKSLLKSMNETLKNLGDVFIDSIDEINNS